MLAIPTVEMDVSIYSGSYSQSDASTRTYPTELQLWDNFDQTVRAFIERLPDDGNLYDVPSVPAMRVGSI